MPRINRIRRARTSGGLTGGQLWMLKYGMLPAGDQDFESHAEFKAAWWRHRTALLAEAPPFQRPFGFWAVEAKRVEGRTEREQLIESGELTAQERTLLTPAERAIFETKEMK